MRNTSDAAVAVVMATYNGEKYMRAQLDSIVNQTYQNIEIYIRDDGSSDDTVNILMEYQEKNSNIHLITDGENLRVPESFYRILRQIPEYDYYAFADQDDIWKEDKIYRAISKLQPFDADEPVLYFSSFDYVDENHHFIRKFSDQSGSIDFYKSIYYTLGLGFTIVFNEKLKEIALPEDTGNYSKRHYGEYHDRRFIRAALCFGKVIYDISSTALHIRHEEAVTSGDNKNTSLLSNWIKDELKGDEMLYEKAGIRRFYKDYHSKLNEEQNRALRLFSSKGHQLEKLFFPHRLRTRISGELLLRILFLVGKI